MTVGSVKAMVLEKFNTPLVERKYPLPEPSAGEVLVRLTVAGVCGSDVHIQQGEDPRVPLPLIPGHEGVGHVAATGGSVHTVMGGRLQRGDLIFWDRGLSCGACYHCLVLKTPSLCAKRRVKGINVPASEPPYLNGCYSQYILLDRGTAIFKLDRSADPVALVSAGCSGATVAHAFDLLPPRPGETVVVQGPGPLGIWAVALARAHGAGKIAVIGGSPERLKLCRSFGADLLLNRIKTDAEERRQAVFDISGGRGADLVVEATGHISALLEGLELVRRGGAWLSVGYAQPAGTAPVDPYRHIVEKNIRVQGVWVSDTAHTWQALQLALANQELFSKMVTHRFPLKRANEALEAVASRSSLKTVLEVSE